MKKSERQKVAQALLKAAEALEAGHDILGGGEDPSVLAGDILRQGMKHEAMQALVDTEDLEKALAKARKSQKGLEKFGSDNISAPALLYGDVMKELENYHKTVGIIIDQIKKRVPKSAIR